MAPSAADGPADPTGPGQHGPTVGSQTGNSQPANKPPASKPPASKPPANKPPSGTASGGAAPGDMAAGDAIPGGAAPEADQPEGDRPGVADPRPTGPSLRTRLRAVVAVLLLSGAAAGAMIYASFSTVEQQLSAVAVQALPAVTQALHLSDSAIATAAALPRLVDAPSQSARESAFAVAYGLAGELRDQLADISIGNDQPAIEDTIIGPIRSTTDALIANLEAQNDMMDNQLNLAAIGRRIRLDAEAPRAALRSALWPLLSSFDTPEPLIQRADTLRRLSEAESALFSQITDAATVDGLQPIAAQLAQNRSNITQLLTTLPDNPGFAKVRAAGMLLTTNHQRAAEMLSHRRLQFDVDTEIAISVTESRGLIDELSRNIASLVHASEGIANAAATSARDDLAAARWWLIAIALLGPALPAAFIWFVFGPNITTRLDRLAAATRCIAAGDLKTPIPRPARDTMLRRDEIGDMTDALVVFRDAMVQLKASEASLRQSEALSNNSERRLRAILAGASAGIGLVDLTGHFAEINPAFRRITGYGDADLAKMTEADLTVDEDRLTSHQKIMDLLRGTVSSFHFEKRYRRADGTLIWVDISGSVLRGPEGQVDGLIFLAQDINERKQAEQELLERERELEDLNQQKNRFFSIIAHDLRSPFNAILGFAEILAQTDKTLSADKVTEYGQLLHGAARNLFDLLEQLLEWSRLQLDRVRFEPDAVDLKEAATLVLRAVKAQATQKGVDIVLDMVPTTAHADGGMIETVLRNLFGNAVKFTPSGGSVRITTAADPGPGRVGIVVADTGVGMTRTQTDDLFKMDRHQSTLGTDNEPGTGLGLLLCHELIGKHGGHIDVVSAPGEGSTFTVLVPAAGSVRPAEAAPTEPAHPSDPGAGTGGASPGDSRG